MTPPRVPWLDFPGAVLLAEETRTKKHLEYAAAKSGDSVAAANLVKSLVGTSGLAAVGELVADVKESGPLALVSAHAYERDGVNAIPGALAELLSVRLGLPHEDSVVQTNIVSHTGAGGYGRLARQAAFGGNVAAGVRFVMVDDFIGQGGTLANLRGWIERQGSTVVGAVGLTGKPYSAKLSPTRSNLMSLGKSTERSLKVGGESDSVTPSTALLNRRLGTSPAPRTLTPYEIDLLQRSKREVSDVARETLLSDSD